MAQDHKPPAAGPKSFATDYPKAGHDTGKLASFRSPPPAPDAPTPARVDTPLAQPRITPGAFAAAFRLWLAEVTAELPPPDHKSAMAHITENADRLAASLQEKLHAR